MQPIIPHWLNRLFYHAPRGVQSLLPAATVRRLAWFAAALSVTAGLLLLLQQGVRAHDAGPTARPILPACYAADLRCTTTEENSTFFAAPETVPVLLPTQPITTDKPHDGKWLQLMPGLVDAAGAATNQSAPLFAVPCIDGFADVYPCNNVDLLAHLPYTAIGGRANNDNWGWRDPLDGHEYALIGAKDGVVFLDITTPTAPLYLGKLPSHGTISSWRDLKVYQDYLFVVADYNPNHGMQVFDLHTLRTVDRAAAPLVLHESAHYSGFDDAHNIAINEESGFAYVVGSDTCAGGLHMVDIHTPTAPTAAGCYSEDGYIHDTTCVLYQGPDQRYQGRELCFNSSVSAVTIVDVTAKSNPVRLARYTNGANVYIHQGWLTDDQRYFVMNDELDELHSGQNTRTYILNVEQIDAPYLAGTYTATLPSIDHNLYISNTYLYEANYTTGLRVLDGKDLAQGRLTEVASFDTFPENNSAAFEGAWTAYPYFHNGVVVVSTIESGVFILRPHLRPDVLLASDQKMALICRTPPPNDTFQRTITVTARNHYTQTVTLNVAVQSGSVTMAAPALAPSPAVTVNPTVLDLHEQAQTTSTLNVDVAGLTSGFYTVTVTAASPETTPLDSTLLLLHVADGKASMSPVSVTTAPLNGQTGITFTWPSVESAAAYRIEIAPDAAFANDLFSAETTATNYHVDNAIGLNQPYFWRVTPINGCGAGRAASGNGQSANGIFLPFVINQ